MQVHLKEKQVFSQMPQAQYTENASARKKKRNIAASTSVYIEMVNNQLLRQIYQSDYPRRARISGSMCGNGVPRTRTHRSTCCGLSTRVLSMHYSTMKSIPR
jgi:hypothetical protein